jgi:hypothetical protein
MSPRARQWWKSGPETVGHDVAETVLALQANQTQRLQNFELFELLYQPQSSVSSYGLNTGNRIQYNLCKSAGETVVSKMAKNEPAPQVVSIDGDYHVRTRARNLTRFSQGLLYEQNAYAVGLDILRDALIYGTGVPKLTPVNGRVAMERISPRNVFVDEVETQWGPPHQFFEARLASRGKLLEMFGDSRATLEDAPLDTTTSPVDMPPVGATVSDNVLVFEAFYVTHSDAPGRHVIATKSGEVLLNESWDGELPYYPLYYSRPVHGFWGEGLVELLMPVQSEINLICMQITEMLISGATRYIFVNTASKVPDGQFTNNPAGNIIRWSGTIPPMVVSPTIVQPELYTALERKIERGYALAGLSLLSAQSVKPPGLNSGVAQREHKDSESDRFAFLGKQWEGLFMRLVRGGIAMSAKLLENGGSYVVQTPGNRFVQSIDLKNAQLESDAYVIQTHPVSSLPQDPAAKLQTVTEWAQAGWITPTHARRLMSMPDIDAFDSHEQAALEWIEYVVGQITSGEVDDIPIEWQPDEIDDLDAIAYVCRSEILLGKRGNLEPERIALLYKYMQLAVAMKQQMAPPPAPQIQPAPEVPQLPPPLAGNQ